MSVTRRTLLRSAGLVGLAGGLSACAGSGSDSGDGSTGKNRQLTFWYWSGALSEDVVKDVTASFAGRATVTPMSIDGDFKQRLTTSLASRNSVPDITGVKGEDLPVFLTRSDQFLDLNTLGASKIAGSFAAAKYAAATTPDGRQIGLPIDLGPTAVFLRADLWAKAGLPSDPSAVSALTRTWDGWFDTARRLKKALPGTFAVRNSTDLFGVAVVQAPESFISRSGEFIGDRGAVKAAWDIAVRATTEGLHAGIYDNAAFNAALASGSLTGQIGPAWNGLDIESGAPQTAGAWRVAECPGGPANIGGSYLTLTTACREPEVAFAYINELLSPANQGRSFTDAHIFPAVIAAYKQPTVTQGQAFYGGQSTVEVFGPTAERLPVVYEAPLNGAIMPSYSTELSNVEGGKDPAKAWQDAVAAGRQTAQTGRPG